MNKKLLITMIAMLTSLTMLTSCSDTTTDNSTTTDTSSTATTDDSTSETSEDVTDDTSDDVASLDEGVIDMENIELTDEEMAQLLGFSGNAETVQEGELYVEFGSADLGTFDVTFEASNYTFEYEGDIWIESGFDVEGTEVVLVDSNPVDFESPANIYFTPVTQIPSYISMNEYVQMVVESSEGAFGVEVLSSGVGFYGDYEVGTLETVERYSEELITEFMELGYITAEDLEMIGGMEVLTALPDMYQIFMVARNGENAYTISGAYFDNDIKRDEIINAVDGFLQTLTVIE